MGKINGDRLKLARLYRGLTLTELSKDVGVSKQSLSQYENEENIPSLEILMRLSNILGFPHLFFFQSKGLNTQTEAATYFRALYTTPKKERVLQSIRVELISEVHSFLSRYIDFPNLNIPSNTYQSLDLSDSDIENIAQNIRYHWKLGDSPIKDFKYTLESNGIIVTGLNTHDKIYAFSQSCITDSEKTYIIVISQNQTVAKVMFDMAHELGHILFHPWSEDIEALSREEFRLRENQANRFAGAFLLPKYSFLRDVGPYGNKLEHYVTLKNKWNVSIQAMLYRAKDLAAINAIQYQYLMRALAKKNWRTNEPGDKIYKMDSTLIKNALDLLFQNNILNGDRLLDELEAYGLPMNRKELETLLFLEDGYLSKNSDNIIPLILNNTKF